jgi:hypothetical protein
LDDFPEGRTGFLYNPLKAGAGDPFVAEIETESA